jgi:hypothetical protein
LHSFDIQLLAKCDYVVATHSSNMGRLVYEFQLITYTDAFLRFKSLDNPYYQHGNNPSYKIAIASYQSGLAGHIDIETNDIILVITHHEAYLVSSDDQFLKGKNMRTNKTGMFPDYIVENFVDF